MYFVRRTASSSKGMLVATALITSFIAPTFTLAGELRALCSAAKDLVTSGKAQEGILITDPTPRELARSTMTYATAKKRYVAELRSVMPIIISYRPEAEAGRCGSGRVSLRLRGIRRRR